MNRSYLFQRAPRLNAQFEKREVEIVPPPSPPTYPGTSIITTVLPLIGTVLGFGFMYYYYATMSLNGAGNAWMFLGGSAAMMISSYLASFIAYSQQKRKYIKDKYRRLNKYREYLGEIKEELEALSRQQRDLMLQVDGSPLSCLEKVCSLDGSLWERSPHDNDYLNIRLGLGERLSAVNVKVPKIDTIIDPDPLIIEAQKLANSYMYVSEVPICLNIREKGSVGLVGDRQAVLNIVRSITEHIAAHHSPDEVKIIGVFPEMEINLWGWMRWLPHVWSDNRQRRFLACKKDEAHVRLKEIDDILSRRSLRRVIEDDKSHELPDMIFILDSEMVEKEPILTRLLSDRSEIGAYTFILAQKREQLPKECRAIIETHYGLGRLLATDLLTPVSFKPDESSMELADEFARRMAPIRLLQVFSPTEIPNSVSLFELLNITSPKELDVKRIWRSSEVYNSLAVPIGLRGGGEPLILNIHESEHGPHGLVAGSTGSGKSELLQSLVCLLAIHYHPQYLGFILVDYKGGGMANSLVDLPHVVGTITNLQGNLANRALTALKGELLRRQQILAELSISHIDDYQRLFSNNMVDEPIPHLVFLVDEFAELKSEQPEFMQELISAVRVGRSLGVHLLLATQKPAGVVDEQMWGNTRFRICLRVERPEDSREVLKRPDAASITKSGRAYLQVGNNESFELFQVVWSGAAFDTIGNVIEDPFEILEVGLDGSKHNVSNGLVDKQIKRTACSQLEAMVSHLQDTANEMKLKKVKGPWMAPLPEIIYLDEIMGESHISINEKWIQPPIGLEAVIGMVDDPAEREQRPLLLNFTREGHVALYGVPGSGKTTFIQTVVTSLVRSYSPDYINMYILDCGARNLSVFENLPHVGGVLFVDETERIIRLFKRIDKEMRLRKEAYANAGVTTHGAFTAQTGEITPAIVVVLDNYAGFVAAFPDEGEQFLTNIVREGGNLGIHLLLTANNPSLIRYTITSNITCSIALQLAERGDYGAVLGRMLTVEPTNLPGRGLIKGTVPLEFQTALPSNEYDEARRSAALRNMACTMSDMWQGRRAEPITMLPELIEIENIIHDKAAAILPQYRVPIGIEVEDFEIVAMNLQDGPHFMVCGPIQSGKTSFLQSFIVALSHRYSPEEIEIYVADAFNEYVDITQLPHVRSYIQDEDVMGEIIEQLNEYMIKRRDHLDDRKSRGDKKYSFPDSNEKPIIVLIIDGYEFIKSCINPYSGEMLEGIIRKAKGLGIHIILSGAPSELSGSYDNWVKALRELQTGVLLGSTEYSDLQMFGIRLPFSAMGKQLPPGEGFYARRRSPYTRFKGAVTSSIGSQLLECR